MKNQKKILIGVTSSISAYKVLDLIPLFLKQNLDLEVVFSSNATKMFDIKQFEKVLNKPIYQDLFETPQNSGQNFKTTKTNFNYQNYLKNQQSINHIFLADSCDLILVCPATSNIISKLANGICDDLLSTTIFASNKPVLICPSMNVLMWQNPILQYNLKKLQKLDSRFVILKPDYGEMACGHIGKGRLPEVEKILNKSLEILNKESLHLTQKINLTKTGEKKLNSRLVLITAGGTTEDLDNVRVITNKSSGKTGIALAQSCLKQNIKVKLLLSTNTNWTEITKFLQTFYPFLGSKDDFFAQDNLQIQTFRTSKDLAKLIKSNLRPNQIVFHAAAVSDFIPTKTKSKISSDKEISLKLKPAPKILGQIKVWEPKCFLVGFKLESNIKIEELTKKAQESLQKNSCDLVVANLESLKTGTENDLNRVWLITENEVKTLKLNSKTIITNQILEKVLKITSKIKH
jgi:phosphopantothenoylcysteine decarboxylase / phosphopantothenate---cysteine ligase